VVGRDSLRIRDVGVALTSGRKAVVKNLKHGSICQEVFRTASSRTLKNASEIVVAVTNKYRLSGSVRSDGLLHSPAHSGMVVTHAPNRFGRAPARVGGLLA
jgi:hypothetical protein